MFPDSKSPRVQIKNDLLIRERSRAGRARYLQDYCAGRVGKTVTSRSGKNLPPHRPKDLFLAGWSINQLFAGYPLLLPGFSLSS
jgi:hypothetical protein